MTIAYFLTDSFGSWTFVNTMSARFGWTPIRDPIGGGGYFVPGVGTNFNVHLATVIASNPDVVVVVGGQNDGGSLDADVIAAVNTFWSRLCAGLPNALFYATTGFHTIGAVKLAAIVAAAKAAGAMFTDWAPWLTGTGYVGHELGDGNRDVYVGPDNTHPADPAGAAYFGTQWAFAIKPPSTGLDY